MILPQTRLTRSLTVLAALFVSLGLTGCGGGTGTEGPDPGIIDYPIAYVKRPVPVDNNGNPLQADLQDPAADAGTGGDLYLRNRATSTATETNITAAITGGAGDVRDVDVSFDGTKLVFSLRLAPTNANPDPTWNLYEYDIANGILRQIITTNPDGGDDIAPRYLPDGRIVFASNRQATAFNLRANEGTRNNSGKPGFLALDEDRNTLAFTLHVVDSDGANLRQITFNPSHDLDPLVLSSGDILYTRWDNASGNDTGFSLYRVSPSGGDEEIVYGAHSHATGTGGATIQFTRPRELPDGSIAVIARPLTGTFGGGDLWRINIGGHVDFDRTLTGNTQGGGQQSLGSGLITTDGSPSPGGRYHDAFPLWDGSGRFLVSKGFCQVTIGNQVVPCTPANLADPAAVEAPPAYAIWMYDPGQRTEKFVIPPEAGMMYTDVVAVQPRRRPSVAAGQTADTILAADNWGLLHIRSIYDMDGTFFDYGSGMASLADLAASSTPAASRPARFLRLVKPVALGDPDAGFPNLTNDAFGPRRNLGMREILGYAPIEPDGSVLVKVPANVPFTLEVLDAAGRRIGARHRHWIQVPPGETLECNGCHQHPNDGSTPLPHGRKGAGPASINPGNWNATALNTNPSIFFLPGETMAQARYNRCIVEVGTCDSAANATPSVYRAEPGFDLFYEDYWNNYIGGNTPNPGIQLAYADLTTPPPLVSDCLDGSVAPDRRHLCRIIINYEQHIEPIWSAPRTDAGGVNRTCTTCHSSVNPNDPSLAQVPAGQLNLDVTPAMTLPAFYPANATTSNGRVFSYFNLLFPHERLELNGNQLQVVMVPSPDGALNPDGTPVLVPDTVAPVMSVNGARASYFMEKMTNTELNAGRPLTGTTDHSGWLTEAELRLIAEWLDLGAQYYNNPFDPGVPTTTN